VARVGLVPPFLQADLPGEGVEFLQSPRRNQVLAVAEDHALFSFPASFGPGGARAAQ